MSVQHKHLLFAITLAATFSGCAVIDGFPNNTTTKAVSTPKQTTLAESSDSQMSQLTALHDSSKVDVAWVFQYYRLISTVSAKMLHDEYEKTRKDYSIEKTPWNQWQMAMLLSLPSAPFHDAERSSMIFKELSESSPSQDPVIKDAAFLMYSWTNAQQHINKRLTSLEGQLGESRSTNKTLQDQLDALKAIEENLSQRNKTEGSPKP